MIIMTNYALMEKIIDNMPTKKLLQTISEKEMDRKEFLKYSGYALLGLVGLKGIANLLIPVTNTQNKAKSESAARGFGSGKYGA